MWVMQQPTRSAAGQEPFVYPDEQAPEVATKLHVSLSPLPVVLKQPVGGAPQSTAGVALSEWTSTGLFPSTTLWSTPASPGPLVLLPQAAMLATATTTNDD